MKRFRNPLETLLEVRRILQRQRETELSLARRKQDEAELVLDQIRARKTAAERYRPAGPATGPSLLQREHFVQHQVRLEGEQSCVLDQAQEAADTRQRALVEARRGVRTFELHRERLHAEWLAEAARDEQRRYDDIANARHALLAVQDDDPQPAR